MPKDYIGFDPVIWIYRLLEVNEGSQFPESARRVIDASLRDLEQRLSDLSEVQ